MGEINWLAALVAAASAFLTGGLWYSLLFAKPWQRAAGLSDDQIRATNPAKLFGLTFLINFVMALVFAAGPGSSWTLLSGAAHGLGIGLIFVSGNLAITYLFERKPAALLWINAGYVTVHMTVMGAVIGAF